jgi:hypothetical protein
MFKAIVDMVSRNILAITVCTCGAIVMLVAANANAANCTINTSPNPANISPNQSVTFSASIPGKPPATYSWDFGCSVPGECDTATSSLDQVTVTYYATGNYVATLNGANSKGQACNEATTTVTVADTGGCTRSAPTFTMGADQFIAADGSAVYTLSVTNNDSTACPDTTFSVGIDSETGDVGSFSLPSGLSAGSVTVAPGANDTTVTLTVTGNGTGADADALTSTVTVSDAVDHTGQDQTDSVITTISTANDNPVARGDAYATPVGTPLDVAASRISGVLYNDFGGTPPLTAQLVSGPSHALSFNLNPDGSFNYTPDGNAATGLGDNENDSFVYYAMDSLGNMSGNATVNINILSKQEDFKILMNYELGMHCTGFEFAYCCVLPPYNSILAQVVRPQAPGTPATAADFPRLLEGDHNNADGLGRPVVMRDYESDGTIKKYFLEYYHDAQPRLEGQGKTQTSTLISAVEGNSLFYHQTIYDSALVDTDGSLTGVEGKLVTGNYEGVDDVVLGDGDTSDATDNYANGWLNHFYIYADLEGSNPGNSSLEADKIRLGVQGHIEYPADVGAALQPMGPTGSAAGFDNVLTFSGDTGTVVYTQMKVLENLPVMLTSPRIWEALGLPLTPFEDSIAFFGSSPDGPGSVNEDSIRPYVAMKARLHEANCDAEGLNCTMGNAVIGSNGHPVIGFGTAPIDIPNCERCHSVPPDDGNGTPHINSPSYVRSSEVLPGTHASAGQTLEQITAAEKSFWDAYYNIVQGVDSDWYSRLKGAAINMLGLHDIDQGTGFTANWPSGTINDPLAQNTRLGKESVICQKCHADNVIAVVKSATKNGTTIKPISEALHWRHREQSEGGNIHFADNAGRSGGCQGCHPAHRSDGVMDGYPITLTGDNQQANSDNRLASGGCFVGRDVHSNPMKDTDGTETPAHLNAVGEWLATNVFHNQDGEAGVAGHDTRGLWCTNCHTQLGQEIWKAENCPDLINGDCIDNPRGQPTLAAVASAAGLSGELEAIAMLDPNSVDLHNTGFGDLTHMPWDNTVADANLATIEVNGGVPQGTVDADGDFSVRILDFCTTDDCVAAAQVVLDGEGNGSVAVAVPFDAATDGRDHWLSPGEPHCADCHSAPYVEPSGANIGEKDFKPPFNYPRKASLMRYSTGHQGVTCQGCHESIHGLYPVTPAIDTTSYAQAAALNHDGSHGPLKCGTCHEVDSGGIPTWIRKGTIFGRKYDDVVTWAHTYTDSASPLDSTCQNCHGDRSNAINESSGKWLRHAYLGRIGRQTMDKAEITAMGHVSGDPDTDGDGINDRTAGQIVNVVCTNCHASNGGPGGNFLSLATCDNQTWLQHLAQGRLSEKVWEFISGDQNSGSTCGW